MKNTTIVIMTVSLIGVIIIITLASMFSSKSYNPIQDQEIKEQTNQTITLLQDDFLIQNPDGTYNISFDEIEEINITYAWSGFGYRHSFYCIKRQNNEYLFNKTISINETLIDNLMTSFKTLNVSNQYHYCDRATDDFPIFIITIKTMQYGTFQIISTSNCNGYLPWNIINGERVFTLYNSKFSKSLYYLFRTIDPERTVDFERTINPEHNYNNLLYELRDEDYKEGMEIIDIEGIKIDIWRTMNDFEEEGLNDKC